MLRSIFLAAISITATANAQDTWERQSTLLPGSGSRVPAHATYAGGRFIMVGSTSSVWTSAAGSSNWAESFLPTPPSFYSSAGIATDGNVVIVTGSDNTLYTTTASSISGLPTTPISWTKLNPGSRTADLGRVRFLNGQFIVTTRQFNDTVNFGDSYTELLTSPDGVAWTSKKFLASATSNTVFFGSDIAFKPGATPGAGIYVVAGRVSNAVFTAPEDLSSLTRVPLNGLSSSGQTVIYADGLFVMATASGAIFTSPNGTTWTSRSLPVAATLFSSVFHDGTTFVAVGRQTLSSASRPAIVKSTDGITWTVPTTFDASAGFSSSLSTLVKADGLWVTTGSSRDLFTSGTSSVGPPVIDPLPSGSPVNAGDDITITANITSSPAPISLQWFKGDLPLTDGAVSGGAVLSGTDTDALTITGASLSDAGNYRIRVINAVSTVFSTFTQVAVSAVSNGAVLTPYGLNNSIGGELLTGSTPAKAMVGISTPTVFSAAGGIQYLPNVPASYQYFGAINPSGTKILLGNQFALAPICVYDLTTETATFLPDVTFPIGPVDSAFTVLPSALADNGDIGGVITAPGIQLYAFHYTAATQTYAVLGNVPNTGNEIATSIGGISADGTTLSGYERNGIFDGAFVWDTTDGFTLLPVPENGLAANGDIRQISPNGRFIVGYGAASAGAGSGQTAMRWDLNSGSPVGLALPKAFNASFADARWVTDDGTTAGNVRIGSSFTNNKASVWLPSGALVILADYLSSEYGLTTPGFSLNQVTSISPDRKTLAGTATNGSGFVEGWLLTLPTAIDIASPEPDAAVQVNSVRANGGSQAFGTIQINSGIYPEVFCHISNFGSSELTISAASITGANPDDFEIFNAPAASLAGTYGVNEIRAFKIRFNPKAGAEGARTAALTVASDDPDTASFVINLTGSATAPPPPTAAEVALESFLSTASVPANLRGPLDDPDNDGVNNLLEFALGLPPMTHSTLPVAVNETGVLTLTYTRAQQTHVTYTVKVSSDLGVTDPWTATGVTQGTPDGSGVTTATIPVIATPRFLRIEVSLTP